MGWLYRGAFSTAYKEGPSNVNNSLGFMGFPFKMLKLLLSYDIKPICIFDGRPLPGKLDTEKRRANDKAKNKALSKEQWESGNKDEARKFATRSLVIKHH